MFESLIYFLSFIILFLFKFFELKKIMCQNESIILPDGLEVTNKNFQKFSEPFLVEIKVILLQKHKLI